MKVTLLLFLVVSITLVYGNNLLDDKEIVNPKLQPIKHEAPASDPEESDELDVEAADEEKDEEEETNEDDDDETTENDDEDDDDATTEEDDNNEESNEDEENNEDEEASKDADENDSDSTEEQDNDSSDEETSDEQELTPPVDLCADLTCKKGRECVVLNGEAKCRCISECPAPVDDEEKVCGNDNVTYASKCDFHRTKCLYNRDKLKQAKHLRVDYYGPCIEIIPCSEFEMQEFPTRMRAWLKNIFLQLYDENNEDTGLTHQQRSQGRKLSANRDRVSKFEHQSFSTIQRDFGRYAPLYRYPVHWKFLTLDNDPADKYLSRSELEPFLGTLIPLEHCAKEFFKLADQDKDHMISLYEWGMSLGLQKEDMDLTISL